MEHPPYSPDLAPNDFWIFPKLQSALTRQRLHNNEVIKNKSDDGTESYSTSGVPKIFPIMAASLG
jgi:hypothetical protein